MRQEDCVSDGGEDTAAAMTPSHKHKAASYYTMLYTSSSCLSYLTFIESSAACTF